MRTSVTETRKKNKGFTLLEVLIVIAIIAGTIALLTLRPTNPDRGIKELMSMINSTVIEVHNAARMSQTTYRLVFQLDGNEEGHNVFWVERALKQGLVFGESKKSLKIESDKEKEQNKQPRSFEPDKKILKKPYPFPTDFRIADVEIGHDGTQIVDGLVYVYVRPEGLVDAVAVHIVNKDRQWTFSIHPLTGRSFYKEGTLALQDLLRSK